MNESKMSKSDNKTSSQGKLTGKRIKLGLALGLMVCLNLWILFDVGWFGVGWTVFVNIVNHLVLFSIKYIWGIASLVIGGGFVAVSSFSSLKRGRSDYSGKEVVSVFYVPRIFVFLLFLLPLWYFVEPISILLVCFGFWVVLILGLAYLEYDDTDDSGFITCFALLFFFSPLIILWYFDDDEDGGERE